MKILFVALKYDYGIPERGYSFEYYNFYDALVGMGHEVEYFDFYTLFLQEGRAGMTRLLRQRVEEWRPDLMFTFLYSDQFDRDGLSAITASKRTITFNWFADDHWRFDDFSRHWAPCFSFVSTTDASAVEKYMSAGYGRVLLTQWGANPSVYHPGDNILSHGVSFTGQAHGNRRRTMREFRKQGIRVETHGSHWNLRLWHRGLRKLRILSKSDLEHIINETRVDQEEMVRIFQSSRINLNLSLASTRGGNQIKGRTFEIPACGGFQLCERADRIEEYFVDGKEIVLASDLTELIEKSRYYLEHEEERTAIARAGYDRVMKEHTYAHRFNALFKAMDLA